MMNYRFVCAAYGPGGLALPLTEVALARNMLRECVQRRHGPQTSMCHRVALKGALVNG